MAIPDPAGEILTIDRSVAHVSEVPAIKGQASRLFLREKVAAALLDQSRGQVPDDKVVLMVHGGFSPAEVAFDLQTPAPADGGRIDETYSWMEVLAGRGFDVFAMNMTGYGASSRPMMDDPGNLPPELQALLIPHTLAAQRAPSYH